MKEGNDIVSKVLTIDEDVKKKNSQRKFDDFDSSVLKESNAGFVLYALSLYDSPSTNTGFFVGLLDLGSRSSMDRLF